MLEAFAGRMDVNKSFSVQARVIFSDTLKKYDVVQQFSDAFTSRGFTLDVKVPRQVVSVIIRGEFMFAGLSDTTQNLSDFPGGMRRYAKYDGQISRAEFKLMEAAEVFGLDFAECETGLDLGAAPGGWTKVLLDYDMRIVCVDPAELDPIIRDNKRVKHFRATAQEFAASGAERFDLIVNDMRMDVADSARIMLELADRLKPGGVFVMTFKLPHKNQMRMIRAGLSILEQRYDVTHARQLFHNRSEITVVGKRAN